MSDLDTQLSSGVSTSVISGHYPNTLLKSFPEISTNIKVLQLKGTTIQEIPPSIRSWHHLDWLVFSYCENLWKSQHAFDRSREIYLSDTGIQEIAPWVKEMSRVRKLIMKGCTKLVSLPQLPDSLGFLDAENCESLERLDCSFYKIRFVSLNFVNCFKLNEEARDLIIKTSTRLLAVFSGEKVPTCFTYRATRSSPLMKLNGFGTHMRFKACLLLVKKGDLDVVDWRHEYVSYSVKDKINGVIVKSDISGLWHKCPPPANEHLFVFNIEEIVSSAELVFEFEFSNEKWEIEECGLCSVSSTEVSL